MSATALDLTQYHVATTSVERIISLRHRILLPDQPVKAVCFDGDRDMETWHFAVFPGPETDEPTGEPVCCASFIQQMYKGNVPAWQLRGMATEPAYQGRGLGTLLLQWGEKRLAEQPEYAYVDLLWCNARAPAVKFYEKNGWALASAVFEIPTVGPHYVMTKSIN